MVLPSEERMLVELLTPEISTLLAEGQTRAARQAMDELMSPEVADVLSELPIEHQAVAFRLLPRGRAAAVFSYLPAEAQEKLIEELTHEQLANLVNAMLPDDAAELFEEMPGQLVTKLIDLMTPENRRHVQAILRYPEESVGRYMTPAYLTVSADWTVAQALEHLRKRGPKAESIHTMYVVDAGGRLIDHIRLKDVLFSDPSIPCSALLKGNTVWLRATDDREQAVRVMERYDLPAVPVVDRDDVMVGIVTFDDVADVAEEEATEDMQKLGGMEALDEPYMTATIFELIRKRGGWLLVLFLGQLATINIMVHYQDQMAQALILTIFVPLIIASGGNSGSQATSLIIRAMAIGEVTLKDWLRVLKREMLCGLLLGLGLGAVGLCRVQIGHWLGFDPATEHVLLVGVTVCAALLCVVLAGTIVGSMLPFILRRVGFDPATASAPFVSMLVDVTGLFIYFLTALTILKGTVLK